MFRSLVYNSFYSKEKSSYICGTGNEEQPVFCPAGRGSLAWLSPPSAESVFRLLPEDGDMARQSETSRCKRACQYPQGISDAGRVDVGYRIFERNDRVSINWTWENAQNKMIVVFRMFVRIIMEFVQMM